MKLRTQIFLHRIGRRVFPWHYRLIDQIVLLKENFVNLQDSLIEKTPTKKNMQMRFLSLNNRVIRQISEIKARLDQDDGIKERLEENRRLELDAEAAQRGHHRVGDRVRLEDGGYGVVVTSEQMLAEDALNGRR